jgi:Fe-Mn family superoxide dismutase
MAFKLSPLPYGEAALAPVISARTMQFHYGKHHAGYVDKLTKLIEGTPYARMSLEQIIEQTARDKDKAPIFNNAAQVWNHDFFWRSMRPQGGGRPRGEIGSRIDKDFGSFDKLAKQFVERAVGQFGSGWTWLVAAGDRLQVVSTPNAEPPMIAGQQALLTCDVWEHAYYLDYQHDRKAFAEAFVDKLANWEFAAEQLARRKSGATSVS